MMGQLSSLMALPARFRVPRAGRLLAALTACISAGLTLSGCTSSWQLPTVLYVAVGISSDRTINSGVVNDVQKQLELLEGGFRRLYPTTTFQVSLYPEDQIVESIRLRTRQGLGPDLLLVNGDTALELLRAGLTDPFPATAEQRHAFVPGELARISNQRGQLAGLPVLVQTQQSCFNRELISEPPATTDQLLAMSADGIPVGLPADLANLFWSAGSLGGLAGFNRATAKQTLTPEEQAGLERWLQWLQNASYQQHVLVYSNQEQAAAELISGQLAWIPCRTTEIPGLRRQMGPRLGIAPLPNGAGGTASPINRLRLMALGRNSSQTGRSRALSFSRFSLNPLTQRNIVLGTQNYLPANRFVRIPVMSSSVLAALVTASQQGRQVNQLIASVHHNDPRVKQLQNLLNELLFGEVSPRDATFQTIRILRQTP